MPMMLLLCLASSSNSDGVDLSAVITGTQLLDTTASKDKRHLVASGALANRRRPSHIHHSESAVSSPALLLIYCERHRRHSIRITRGAALQFTPIAAAILCCAREIHNFIQWTIGWPSVQLDLKSGTICQQTSDSRRVILPFQTVTEDVFILATVGPMRSVNPPLSTL